MPARTVVLSTLVASVTTAVISSGVTWLVAGQRRRGKAIQPGRRDVLQVRGVLVVDENGRRRGYLGMDGPQVVLELQAVDARIAGASISVDSGLPLTTADAPRAWAQISVHTPGSARADLLAGPRHASVSVTDFSNPAGWKKAGLYVSQGEEALIEIADMPLTDEGGVDDESIRTIWQAP